MNQQDSTSWTILRGAASGDEVARAEFIRRYLPAVRAFLRIRWRGTTLADQLEDAVQEVFIQLLKPGSVLDDGLGRIRNDTFRGYLYGLVRNVALMTERRSRNHSESLPSGIDLETLEASEVEFSAAFDRSWAKATMAEALALLSERGRTGGEEAARRLRILRLRYGEGLSADEIAGREGVSRATAYRQLEAGAAEFRDCLDDVIRRRASGPDVDVGQQSRRIIELLHSP